MFQIWEFNVPTLIRWVFWFEFPLRCTRWELIQIYINWMSMSPSSFWNDLILWTIHTIVWYDKWWVNFDLTTLISINIITCMLSDIQRAKSIILWVVQSYYTTCTYSVKSYLSISADANKYIRLYGYTNKNINVTIDQFMIKDIVNCIKYKQRIWGTKQYKLLRFQEKLLIWIDSGNSVRETNVIICVARIKHAYCIWSRKLSWQFNVILTISHKPLLLAQQPSGVQVFLFLPQEL